MIETTAFVAHVRGAPRAWLRLEGAAVALLALALYGSGGHPWLLLALLFFVPDLSFAGYLAGPRAGALLYNALHSYLAPLALAAFALVRDGAGTAGLPLALALIWAAHIGFDRLLGYGLKYDTGFAHTHLGPIGAARGQAPAGAGAAAAGVAGAAGPAGAAPAGVSARGEAERP
jgi:hypothetical protein